VQEQHGHEIGHIQREMAEMRAHLAGRALPVRPLSAPGKVRSAAETAVRRASGGLSGVVRRLSSSGASSGAASPPLRSAQPALEFNWDGWLNGAAATQQATAVSAAPASAAPAPALSSGANAPGAVDAVDAPATPVPVTRGARGTPGTPAEAAPELQKA